MREGIHNPFKHHLIGVFVITLVCIICYSNTLDSPFVFDDFPNIKNNPHIRVTNLDFDQLYDAAFRSRNPKRPVANVSFALNYYFGEYDPAGYHIVNIIVHLISGILVYLLALIIFKQLSDVRLQQATQSLKPSIPRSLDRSIGLMSLFTALIFIAHPIQTQSVTYIVQRMNSMAAMFYLLSLLLYIYGRLAQVQWRRWALFSACLLSWIMALGCKQITATLPIAVLLYESCFFQDLSVAWLKRNTKYLVVPIAIFCLLAFMYLGPHPFDRISAGYAHRDFTMWERVLTQFRVVIFYISLLLYPHPSRLNLLHHFTTSHSLFDPITTLLSLLAITSLIGLGIYLAKKQRLISFCILWFFIHLIIESSFISLEMIFEHRLYLPMLGFSLIVAYTLFHFLSNKRLLAVIISLIITVSLSTATYLRNRIWQDDITLWSDVTSKNPESPRAHYNLGTALAWRGRPKEAISHYREAVRIKPDYVHAHNNLGIALAETGSLDEAISHYYQALRIKPRHAEAHYNLGIALMRQGNLNEAISHFSKALHIRPDHVDAYNNLGNALVRQGRPSEAIGCFSQALQIKPDDVKAHSNLAVVLMGQGRLNEAIGHLLEALRIKPEDPTLHSNLGAALVRQGRLKEAARHFAEALRIKPDDANARYNLEAVKQLMNKAAGPPNTSAEP